MADERNACPLRGAGREAPVPCLGPRCMWWVRREPVGTRPLGSRAFGSCAVALANVPALVKDLQVITRDLEGVARDGGA